MLRAAVSCRWTLARSLRAFIACHVANAPLPSTARAPAGVIPLEISSDQVVKLSGLAVHTIARRSGDPADVVPGMLFRLTPAEIEATDRYEVDAYARVEAALASGVRAFVYVGPDL